MFEMRETVLLPLRIILFQGFKTIIRSQEEFKLSSKLPQTLQWVTTAVWCWEWSGGGWDIGHDHCAGDC